MKESFKELKPEKRRKIINAGLEVFSKSDYKHAATDEIAAKAGISKGLLFYYFHDKKSYYEYLLNYVMTSTEKLVLGDRFNEITDFFELLEYAAQRKLKICEKMPYLMDFMLSAYFSQSSPAVKKLEEMIKPSDENKVFMGYFKNINIDKFKSPQDLQKCLQMFLWLTEGYLLELHRQGGMPDMHTLMKNFSEWSTLFKNTYYKEEYL